MDIISRKKLLEEAERKYDYLNGYLIEFQRKINDNYDIGVIDTQEKYRLFKRLNSIFKDLEKAYQSVVCTDKGEVILENDNDVFSMDDLKEDDDPVLTDDLVLKVYPDCIGSSPCESLFDTFKFKADSANLDVSFDRIKKEVINISQSVGFSTLKRGLTLIIGRKKCNNFSRESQLMIDFFNKYFIPTSYYHIKTQNINKPYVTKNTNSFKNKKLFLYLNGAEVHIPNIKEMHNIDNKIVFKGYFINDVLHTAISGISYGFLSEQRQMLFDLLSTLCANDKGFREGYLNKYRLSEFLSDNKHQMKSKIEASYKKIRKIKKMHLSDIVTMFNNGSISEMYDILSLLLSSTSDYCNIAYILFRLIKSKRVNDTELSTLLFQNLHYTFQHKMRKAKDNIDTTLKKLKKVTLSDIDFKTQIAICENMPENVKATCLEKVNEIRPMSNDFSKQLLFLKTLLDFPWPKADAENEVTIEDDKETRISYLDTVKAKLDKVVYGHKEAKNTLARTIGKWMANPKSGNSLGFVGPPGVGKTLLANGVGKALGIPFTRIILGGQNDGEILHGHGFTYSSAQPGMIIKKMIEAKGSRCVMYFDELDKVALKNGVNEIFGILINLTDPNTNNQFQDRFFQGIDFDLSNVLFIFSYNDRSKVDPILLDRIIEIETKPHSIKNKICITQQFMIPEILKELKFDKDSIIITDEECEYIIENYTYEAGVRKLKEFLQKIVLELNLARIYEIEYYADGKTYTAENPLKIDRKMIEKYIVDKPIMDMKKVHSRDIVGVINGLYATSVGIGGITPIQISPFYATDEKRFDLHLTGSQGEVMQESIKVAFTVAWNYLSAEQKEKLESGRPFSYHVHAPSGATPKDGPSAGGAFTLAFISRLLNIPIRHDAAITGEMELTGNLTKIGGLHAKLVGAKKAGVRLAIVPLDNKDDLEKITEAETKLIDSNFQVMLMNNIYDIIDHFLVKDKSVDESNDIEAIAD